MTSLSRLVCGVYVCGVCVWVAVCGVCACGVCVCGVFVWCMVYVRVVFVCWYGCVCVCVSACTCVCVCVFIGYGSSGFVAALPLQVVIHRPMMRVSLNILCELTS